LDNLGGLSNAGSEIVEIENAEVKKAAIDANGFYSGVNGKARLTAQTALVNTTTLCTAANCNNAALYDVDYFIADTTVTPCGAAGSVSLTLGWTDDAGAKTLTVTPQNGAGLSTTLITVGAGTSDFGSGRVEFWSTGAANITYAIAYTACTVSGTGTYSVALTMQKP
jgi:hypothetical protein